MEARMYRSSLRRSRAPFGALLALALALPLSALAATPTPDPPPLPVSPEPPPAATTQPAPVRTTPAVVAPPHVVDHPPPVVRQQPMQTPAAPKAAVKAKPKATAKPDAAAKRPARVVETVAAPRLPHDRGPVPLVAFLAQDPLDRGLLAVAGVALLLVALGGAVLLGVARRQLLTAGFVLALLVPVDAASAAATHTLSGNAGSNGWFTSNVTIRWNIDLQGVVDSTLCPSVGQVTAEGTSERQCILRYEDGSTWSSPIVSIRIDKTAPTVSAGAASRGPDVNGWYNHPVGFGFSGTESTSGVAGCTSPTYSGGD